MTKQVGIKKTNDDHEDNMPRTRPSHDDCNYCNPNEDGNDNGGDNSDNSFRLLETDQPPIAAGIYLCTFKFKATPIKHKVFSRDRNNIHAFTITRIKRASTNRFISTNNIFLNLSFVPADFLTQVHVVIVPHLAIPTTISLDSRFSIRFSSRENGQNRHEN